MDGFTFTSNMVSAFVSLVTGLAWPILIIGLVYFFKTEIKDVIPNVKKWWIGNSGMEMQEAKKIGEEIPKLEKQEETEQKKAEDVKESIVKQPDLSEEEKSNLLHKFEESIGKSSQLEMQRKHLENILLSEYKKDNLTGLHTFRNVWHHVYPRSMDEYPRSMDEISPGRKEIIRAMINIMGSKWVATALDSMIISGVRQLISEMESGKKNHPFNQGSLSGLSSVGILEIDTLTPLGISIFKSVAREMLREEKLRKVDSGNDPSNPKT